MIVYMFGCIWCVISYNHLMVGRQDVTPGLPYGIWPFVRKCVCVCVFRRGSHWQQLQGPPMPIPPC